MKKYILLVLTALAIISSLLINASASNNFSDTEIKTDEENIVDNTFSETNCSFAWSPFSDEEFRKQFQSIKSSASHIEMDFIYPIDNITDLSEISTDIIIAEIIGKADCQKYLGTVYNVKILSSLKNYKDESIYAEFIVPDNYIELSCATYLLYINGTTKLEDGINILSGFPGGKGVAIYKDEKFYFFNTLNQESYLKFYPDNTDIQRASALIADLSGNK